MLRHVILGIGSEERHLLSDDVTGNQAVMTPAALSAWEGGFTEDLPTGLPVKVQTVNEQGTIVEGLIKDFHQMVLDWTEDYGWLVAVPGSVVGAGLFSGAIAPWVVIWPLVGVGAVALVLFTVANLGGGAADWAQGTVAGAKQIITNIEATAKAAGQAMSDFMKTATETAGMIYDDAKAGLSNLFTGLLVIVGIAAAVLIFGRIEAPGLTVGRANPRRRSRRRRNPPVGKHGEKVPAQGYLPGYATELRYTRRGPSKGYYYHKFTTHPRIRVNRDGSVTLVPRRKGRGRYQLYELGPA